MEAHGALKLLDVFRVFALLVLVGLLAVVILAQVYAYHDAFGTTAEQLRNDYLEQQRQLVRREVERVAERIRYRRSTLKSVAEELARQRVLLAERMALTMLRGQDTHTSAADAQAQLLRALSAIRWDEGSGYLFVLDRDGKVLMHPIHPEYVGRILSEMRDTEGRSFIQQVLKIARTEGEGRLLYDFDKPGHPDHPLPKLSYVKRVYVKRVEPYDFIIVSGVYLEDVEAREKRRILDEIQQLHYGMNGYLFVDEWNGLVLAHGGQPELVGTNIWGFEDSNGVKVVQKLIEAAQTEHGQFVYYRWRKPDTGEERPKVSFAIGIPEWRWMIGTGVYVDDIEQDIDRLRLVYRRQMQKGILHALVGAAVMAGLLALVVRLVNGLLLNDFARFRTFFKEAATADRPIDKETLRYSEFRDQADDANRMLADKLAAERRLLEHQSQLEETIAERTRSLEEKSRELAETNLELERLAATDPLTGLLNRRSFYAQALGQMALAERHQRACCLVLLDLDDFKTINDAHGHGTGDRVLQGTAARLSDQLRASDLLARWGGEEITIFLPQTDLGTAASLCERLRSALADRPMVDDLTVTASFGVTDCRPGDDLERMLRRADQALYRAKQKGRNRVEGC